MISSLIVKLYWISFLPSSNLKPKIIGNHNHHHHHQASWIDINQSIEQFRGEKRVNNKWQNKNIYSLSVHWKRYLSCEKKCNRKEEKILSLDSIKFQSFHSFIHDVLFILYFGYFYNFYWFIILACYLITANTNCIIVCADERKGEAKEHDLKRNEEEKTEQKLWAIMNFFSGPCLFSVFYFLFIYSFFSIDSSLW